MMDTQASQHDQPTPTSDQSTFDVAELDLDQLTELVLELWRNDQQIALERRGSHGLTQRVRP